MKQDKPLNGIGPGAGMNARDAATQRELKRIAKASRKLEQMCEECRACQIPTKKPE